MSTRLPKSASTGGIPHPYLRDFLKIEFSCGLYLLSREAIHEYPHHKQNGDRGVVGQVDDKAGQHRIRSGADDGESESHN